ncbi:MAG: cytochrome c [Hyphomicrobium sp.]|nr:cytochrome c [Hyphomicrobium sp.]MBN9276464.1 cytochrome c [Hyphomicrobium sp.]
MKKSSVLAGVAVLATIAVGATGVSVVAQDTIAQRKALMKAVGGASKTGSQMAKGEVPFDAAKASEAMGTIATSWAAFAKLFPKGSETGGETTASPKIWESFKDFEDKGAKLASDATAAQKAAANGADTFKAAFGDVTKNCGGCHKPYRIQK